MPPVPGRRIGLQTRAHAKVGGGRKLASESAVNSANHRHRIANQIRIVDVKKRLRAQTHAGLEEFLQRILPVLHHFVSDGSRIDRVTEDTAKHRRQTGGGWKDFERFPMRLHHKGVWISLEKSVQGKKVGRSLEHETSCWSSV